MTVKLQLIPYLHLMI